MFNQCAFKQQLQSSFSVDRAIRLTNNKQIVQCWMTATASQLVPKVF